MTYDFELRLPDDAEAPAARLREAAALHATQEAPDVFVLALPPSGRAALRVLAPTGASAYLTAGLELGAPAEEAGELLERLVTLAAGCGARLVDPQLGRIVGLADRPAVERRYTEAAEFAVRWSGQATDPRGFGAEAVIPKATSTLPTKALLGAVALVAAVLFLGDALLSMIVPTRGRPSYYEPAPGEPPAWWQGPDAPLEPPVESLPVQLAERLRTEEAAEATAELAREVGEVRRAAARAEEATLRAQQELLRSGAGATAP